MICPFLQLQEDRSKTTSQNSLYLTWPTSNSVHCPQVQKVCVCVAHNLLQRPWHLKDYTFRGCVGSILAQTVLWKEAIKGGPISVKGTFNCQWKNLTQTGLNQRRLFSDMQQCSHIKEMLIPKGYSKSPTTQLPISLHLLVLLCKPCHFPSSYAQLPSGTNPEILRPNNFLSIDFNCLLCKMKGLVTNWALPIFHSVAQKVDHRPSALEWSPRPSVKTRVPTPKPKPTNHLPGTQESVVKTSWPRRSLCLLKLGKHLSLRQESLEWGHPVTGKPNPAYELEMIFTFLKGCLKSKIKKPSLSHTKKYETETLRSHKA